MFIAGSSILIKFLYVFLKVEYMDYVQIIRLNLFNKNDVKAVPIRFSLPSRYPQDIWTHQNLNLLIIIRKPINREDKPVSSRESTLISICNPGIKEIFTLEVKPDIFKIILVKKYTKNLCFDVFTKSGYIQRLAFKKKDKKLILVKEWFLGENLICYFNYKKRMMLREVSDKCYLGINSKYQLLEICLP